MRGLWPRRVFSNGVILNVPMQQVLYQGTTSVVPMPPIELSGLYSLRKNSFVASFVTRARL